MKRAISISLASATLFAGCSAPDQNTTPTSTGVTPSVECTGWETTYNDVYTVNLTGERRGYPIDEARANTVFDGATKAYYDARHMMGASRAAVVAHIVLWQPTTNLHTDEQHAPRTITPAEQRWEQQIKASGFPDGFVQDTTDYTGATPPLPAIPLTHEVGQMALGVHVYGRCEM